MHFWVFNSPIAIYGANKKLDFQKLIYFPSMKHQPVQRFTTWNILIIHSWFWIREDSQLMAHIAHKHWHDFQCPHCLLPHHSWTLTWFPLPLSTLPAPMSPLKSSLTWFPQSQFTLHASTSPLDTNVISIITVHAEMIFQILFILSLSLWSELTMNVLLPILSAILLPLPTEY